MSFNLSLMLPEERDELLDWIDVVDPGWVAPMTRLIRHNPVFRDKFSLICREDGRLVGHLMVVPQKTALAKIPFRTGRVHWVAVDPSRQRRGIGKMMTNWWLSRMPELGLELSWLVGIEGYYERFDYYYAFPSYDTAVPHTISLILPGSGPPPETSGRPYTVENWNPDLSQATRKLFLAANRPTACEIKHDLDGWRFLMGEVARTDQLEVVTGDGHEVAALLWWRPKGDSLNLRYGLAADESAAAFCINHLQAQAARDGLKKITLHLPPDHHLGTAALELGGRMRSPYHKIGKNAPGGMVRLNDPKNVLAKLEPVLSKRLDLSFGRDYRKKLLLDLPSLQILLDMADGRVKVASTEKPMDRFTFVSLSPEALTQLVVGFKEVDALVAEKKIAGASDDLELLKKLFPAGYPFLFMSV
jgi:GNAT superfamily N-acetyltransferase